MADFACKSWTYRRTPPVRTCGLRQSHRELQEDQSEVTKSVATNQNSRYDWRTPPVTPGATGGLCLCAPTESASCTGCNWRILPVSPGATGEVRQVNQSEARKSVANNHKSACNSRFTWRCQPVQDLQAKSASRTRCDLANSDKSHQSTD